MQTPPARVDFRERRFAGLPWRDAGVLAFSAIAAVALFVLLPHVPFVPRAIGAIALVAFGAGVAFLRPEGLTVEQWLLEVLASRRRTRYRLKGVLKRAGVRVQMAEPSEPVSPEPEQPPAVKPEPPPASPAAPTSGLIELSRPLGAAVLLATLFIFSVLVSLTLYLAGGGADRLYSLLTGL